MFTEKTKGMKLVMDVAAAFALAPITAVVAEKVNTFFKHQDRCHTALNICRTRCSTSVASDAMKYSAAKLNGI